MENTYQGVVVRIVGSVIDVKFEGHLPKQNEVLTLCNDSQNVLLEVMAHRRGGICRCISL